MATLQRSFSLDGTKFVCVIHHCRHPFDDLGGFDEPPAGNNLNLVDRSDWDVEFDTTITFKCDDGMHVENEEIDPTVTEYDVKCIDVIGEYDTPVRNRVTTKILRRSWGRAADTGSMIL